MFNKRTLLEKENFCGNLNMEDITDVDLGSCMQKDFEIKNLGEYHDLYLKINTLLSANVFKNLRKMSLKIYHWDPVKFLLAPGLAWKVALKKAEVKFELLPVTDMLLIVEKELEEEYVMQFINMQNQITNMIKINNLHILNIGCK